MSIQAVKAVAIGAGFAAGGTPGSRFHDEILYDDERGLHRGSNRAGGLEGGVTNGEELRAQAVVKPIPTLVMPLRSIDLRTKEAAERLGRAQRHLRRARRRRGGRGHGRLVLADALLEKFGGDSLTELARPPRGHPRALARVPRPAREPAAKAGDRVRFVFGPSL